MSSLVGPEGRVHAFEPIPAMQELIERSIEHNHVSNITLHPFAFGSESNQLELAIVEGHAGRSSFVYPASHELGKKLTVPVQRLDDVLDNQIPSPIRLVKIDVEGFEAEVLRGAYEQFANALQTPCSSSSINLRDQQVNIPRFKSSPNWAIRFWLFLPA